MLLAFLNDQIQQHASQLYKDTRQRFRMQRTLWERTRATIELIDLTDCETLWQLIAEPGSEKARLVIVDSSYLIW